MAKANLKKTTNWILVHEGGYVNHPDDPGGATNKGVIQRTYDAYRRRKRLSPQSVRSITMEEVYEIYKDQYWDKVWGDQLPVGLDYTMYDFAINSGPARAVKFLQRRLGVTEDGILGHVTLDAVLRKNDIESLIIDINYDRWNWMKRLRHWGTFGRGWTRRVMGEDEGVQLRDHGVIDRSVMMFKGAGHIPEPKALDDGANARTDQETLKRTEIVKEGFNLRNIGTAIGGSVPGWVGAAATLPEGPLQWATAAIAVIAVLFVGYVLVKKLK